MLNDRWSSGVPDEVEFPLGELPADEMEEMEEVDRLHRQLKLKIQSNRERQKEALEKYGVVLDPTNELRARLNLLTDMFIGTVSTERLHFEINWQKMISESVEEGIAGAQERMRAERRSKDLHLPNGRVLKVDPNDDKG